MCVREMSRNEHSYNKQADERRERRDLFILPYRCIIRIEVDAEVGGTRMEG